MQHFSVIRFVGLLAAIVAAGVLLSSGGANASTQPKAEVKTTPIVATDFVASVETTTTTTTTPTSTTTVAVKATPAKARAPKAAMKSTPAPSAPRSAPVAAETTKTNAEIGSACQMVKAPDGTITSSGC